MYSTKVTETIETTDDGSQRMIEAERFLYHTGQASTSLAAEVWGGLLRDIAAKLPAEVSGLTVTFSIGDHAPSDPENGHPPHVNQTRIKARATFEERPAGPEKRGPAASIPSFAIGTATT